MAETEITSILTLVGVGLPKYSSRGLTQTLEPIPAAMAFRRTVNGKLVNTAAPQFEKFHSIIQSQNGDVDPPSFTNGKWPGQVIVVGCIAEIAVEPGGQPCRPQVDSNFRVDDDGTMYFHPQLTMTVTNFNIQKDEWGAITTWQLELEETGP